MADDLQYWEDHGDPTDPYPDDNTMGGHAFMVQLQHWEARHQSKPPPAPPGPTKKPALTTGGSTTSGSSVNFDLSGFSAGAVAEAEQEATDFAGWLGWPTWFDYNAQVKNLLSAGLQADANQAYQMLWTQLKPDQQKANPNAYFGLTQQQYTEKLNNLSDQFSMLTGSATVPDALKNQALRENWTQSELTSHLVADPTLGATSPWLAAGQTFKDVQSQFASLYGSKPTGPSQLASWWQFRSGAQAVTAGGPATEVNAAPPSLVQRPLIADVQTR